MNDYINIVEAAIREVLLEGVRNPKRLLTEHDMQSWVTRQLIDKLNIEGEDALLGIHNQMRFLDSNGKLMIEPDIGIFKLMEYTIDENDELTSRKGATFWGASILVELKLNRGCRKIEMIDLLSDIDKLSMIREIHYSHDDEEFTYHPIFAYYSRSKISEGDRERITQHGVENDVKTIIVDCVTDQFQAHVTNER